MLALPVCVCGGGDYDVAPLIRIYNLIDRFMIILFVSLSPPFLR